MVTAVARGKGLFWKEWRAKRWTLATLAGALAACAFLSSVMDNVTRPWVLAGAFGLCVMALGSLLFSRQEHDPATAFVYALPVSRRRLLAEKLAALASQCLVLALAYCLAVALENWLWASRPDGHDEPPLGRDEIAIVALCCAPAVAVLGAVIGLYLRSAIVTVLFGAVCFAPVFRTLSLGAAVFNAVDRDFAWLAGEAAILSAGLAAWLFWLFCRTPVQELGEGPRSTLAMLFCVALVEAAFTVFLCDWRDLAFIVFGI